MFLGFGCDLAFSGVTLSQFFDPSNIQQKTVVNGANNFYYDIENNTNLTRCKNNITNVVLFNKTYYNLTNLDNSSIELQFKLNCLIEQLTPYLNSNSITTFMIGNKIKNISNSNTSCLEIKYLEKQFLRFNFTTCKEEESLLRNTSLNQNINQEIEESWFKNIYLNQDEATLFSKKTLFTVPYVVLTLCVDNFIEPLFISFYCEKIFIY